MPAAPRYSENEQSHARLFDMHPFARLKPTAPAIVFHDERGDAVGRCRCFLTRRKARFRPAERLSAELRVVSNKLPAGISLRPSALVIEPKAQPEAL